MFKRRKKFTLLSTAAAVGVLASIGTVAFLQQALADTPATLKIAIPSNVEVVVGSTQVHTIGRPTSVSPVNCAPGTPFPQSAVILDPGGAHASQIAGVLNFHDHEIPNGTRYQITDGPAPCNTDFQLYTGTIE